MSPLLFLAIPVIVFVLGACYLALVSRIQRGPSRFNRTPEDLQAVVPMLQHQRERGFNTRPSSSARR